MLEVGKIITGAVGGMLATVIKVSFVFILLNVSLTLAVKLITQPLPQLTVMFWEKVSLAPDKVKLKNSLAPV